MGTEKQLYTISIYTENNIGLLNRISAIFQRRHINIESINTSVSEIEGVSRFTILVSMTEDQIKKILGQIEKQFGKGTVMKMGDREIVDIPSVSTGSLGLDIALGIGGLPKGRVVEIFGPESSGKTTLTLQVIAEAQKVGKTCAFVDAEHALLTLCDDRVRRDLW